MVELYKRGELTVSADLYPYAAGLKSEQDLENHTGIINWVNVKNCEFYPCAQALT
jgi:hypothetical protein